MARKGRIEQDLNRFKEIVAASRSYAEVIAAMNYKASGGVYRHLAMKCAAYEIDTKHFVGQGWSKGKTRLSDRSLEKEARKKETPWKDAFCKNSKSLNKALLRRLVLEKGIEYKCSICGIFEWRGKRLRLHLDHINGDRTDCREENLRLICPNCDSQTTTYSRGLRQKRELKHWWERI